MKIPLISATLLAAMFSCGEADNRVRTPDPRFTAAEGCINDSTIQEIFDENGKPY